MSTMNSRVTNGEDRRRWRELAAGGFAFMLLCTAFVARAQSPSFEIYDGLLGVQGQWKPFATDKIHVMYMWAAWGGDAVNVDKHSDGSEKKNYALLPPLDYLLSHGYVDDAGKFQRGGYLYDNEVSRDFDGLVALDLESWGTGPIAEFKKLQAGGQPERVLRETKRVRAKYLTVIHTVRGMFPKARIGWYGLAGAGYPVSSFPRVNESQLDAWRKINDFYKPVFDQLDVLLPSLYFSRTLADRKAKTTLAEYHEKVRMVAQEQRRLAPGKKVIAFISPYYMDDYPVLPGIDEWRTAVQVLKDNLDGVIVWNKREPKIHYRDLRDYLELLTAGAR